MHLQTAKFEGQGYQPEDFVIVHNPLWSLTLSKHLRIWGLISHLLSTMAEALIPRFQFLIDPLESHCYLYNLYNLNSFYKILSYVFNLDIVDIF